MLIELNTTVSTNFKELRQVQAFYKNATELNFLENPSDRYRVDRFDAMGYFDIFPKWKNKVISYIEDLKKMKEKFVYIDVCGRASGQRLGADTSYLFSLRTDKLKRMARPKGDVFVDGDLFNRKDFSVLLGLVREDVAPAFITFRPMAGLQNYSFINKETKNFPNYEKITYGLLGKRLADVIEVLRPGGFILLERPFQCIGLEDFFKGVPQDKSEFTLLVKSFAKKIKCSVDVLSSIGGPYFLLRKWLR